MRMATVWGRMRGVMACAVVACAMGPGAVYGQAPPNSAAGATRDLFAGEPLEVALEIAPADWDVLRADGRTLPQILSGCFTPEFEYARVSAHVSIDGEALPDVSVRKKGFLGSLSTVRPSLKLDVGRGEHDGRTIHGARDLTLNNNRQDPTNAKQCAVYELFTRAGLPAPRCGLAHVSVNGEDKGFFTNVEPVDEAFLRRVFGNDEGNLYEMTIGDFTPEWKGGFDLKTNEEVNDRSDLDRVERALAAPDEGLEAALGEVFDFDELLTFWAMEVLTGHWDGMTGNRNNTFIYHDPADDLFHPIPWGADGTFQAHPLIPNVPTSVFTFNTISSRLYAIPAMRQRYQARLRALLDEVWDEERIVARLREIAAQTGGNAATLALTETFVRGRQAAIEAELATNEGRGPEITTARPFEAAGCREALPASGVIDFVWNDVPTAFAPVEDLAALQLDIPLPDGAVRFVPGQVTQLATINAEGLAQLGLAGLDATRKGPVAVLILIPEEQYRVGQVPFHGVETMGVVVSLADQRTLGLIGEGSITLTEVGRQNGDRVRGRWEGFVAEPPIGATPTP